MQTVAPRFGLLLASIQARPTTENELQEQAKKVAQETGTEIQIGYSLKQKQTTFHTVSPEGQVTSREPEPWRPTPYSDVMISVGKGTKESRNKAENEMYQYLADQLRGQSWLRAELLPSKLPKIGFEIGDDFCYVPTDKLKSDIHTAASWTAFQTRQIAGKISRGINNAVGGFVEVLALLRSS